MSQTSTCQACVIMLIRKCYGKNWRFRLVREPLVAGMRFLALVNGLNPQVPAGANPECKGCLRFLKADLEDKSATFRYLNRFIGPRFRKLRDAHLEEIDFEVAKREAKQRMGQTENHE